MVFTENSGAATQSKGGVLGKERLLAVSYGRGTCRARGRTGCGRPGSQQCQR